MTIIEQIKAEIERRKNTDGVCQNNNETADIYYARGARFTCEALLSFLSTFESEKPMVLEKMEWEEELKKAVHQVSEEIVKEIFPDDLESGDFFTEIDLKNCITRVAYQFADWGAEHLKKQEI